LLFVNALNNSVVLAEHGTLASRPIEVILMEDQNIIFVASAKKVLKVANYFWRFKTFASCIEKQGLTKWISRVKSPVQKF
jgi:hypothetical protein